MNSKEFREKFTTVSQENLPTAEWWARVEDGGSSRVLVDRVNGYYYHEDYFNNITVKKINKSL